VCWLADILGTIETKPGGGFLLKPSRRERGLTARLRDVVTDMRSQGRDRETGERWTTLSDADYLRMLTHYFCGRFHVNPVDDSEHPKPAQGDGSGGAQ
jgi:hypothetical protein